MKAQELAAIIDHTILKPEADENDIRRLCRETIDYGFCSVCVNPVFVELATAELKNSDVKVCSVIGFPLGANCTEIKVAEAAKAISDGAMEIDMVINVGALKSGKYDFVFDDISAVSNVCHENGAILKVIIEICLLSDSEIVKACEISKLAKADFVKTSTGFNKSGATVEAVKLMRETVGSNVGVKASGGIRTAIDAISMINAGANRLGMSSGIAAISELDNLNA